MKIGAEIEFWAKFGVPNSIFEKYEIVHEYYSGMYELNKYLATFTKRKDIEKFLEETWKDADKIVSEIKEVAPASLDTIGLKIDDKGVVYNGLHIHISLNSLGETLRFYEYLSRYNIVENWKLNNYPSFRSIWSHHIWGGKRGYNYNYKTKDKFKPIILTDFGTVEIRIFDNEDIKFASRRKELSKFLMSAIEDFRNGIVPNDSNYYHFNNGEDVEYLYDFCVNKLERKNRYRFKGGVLTCPSGQKFKLNDDYIEIIKEVL